MNAPRFTPPPHERGAALLSVLLLVAVMAVIAAMMLDRVSIATRLAANGQAMTQARLIAYAAETVAIEQVKELVEADSARTVDRAGLLTREFTLPFDNGMATARMQDAGNCFNVNSVVAGQDGQYSLRPLGRQQFISLALTLEIPEGEAGAMADALVDWIDSDQVPLPNGAEDQHYRGADTPYATADKPVADITELRALRHMTADHYDRLRPWLCALPTTDLSPINVNTLRVDQARLLAMLNPAMISIDRARGVLAARPATGWGSTVDFWRPFAAQGQILGPEIEQQVQLKSRWFLLAMRIRSGSAELEERALIDAQLTPARLVHRSWGEDI